MFYKNSVESDAPRPPCTQQLREIYCPWIAVGLTDWCLLDFPEIWGVIQGDHSACGEPPIDFKAKVPFWPGLPWPSEEYLFCSQQEVCHKLNGHPVHSFERCWIKREVFGYLSIEKSFCFSLPNSQIFREILFLLKKSIVVFGFPCRYEDQENAIRGCPQCLICKPWFTPKRHGPARGLYLPNLQISHHLFLSLWFQHSSDDRAKLSAIPTAPASALYRVGAYSGKRNLSKIAAGMRKYGKVWRSVLLVRWTRFLTCRVRQKFDFKFAWSRPMAGDWYVAESRNLREELLQNPVWTNGLF